MRRPRRRSFRPIVSFLVLAVATACNGGADPPDSSVAAPRSPTEVVSALLRAIDEGRFEDTAPLTDTTQAALFTLAEGATATEVATAIEGDSGAVAANFWSGFAQSLPEDFSPSDVSVELVGEGTEGESRFAAVSVSRGDDPPRTFVLRRQDGWRVDLFASFASIVAGTLVPAVDGVLTSASGDASAVLTGLSGSADSLRYALAEGDLSGDMQQTVLALLERVTRSGG
jgi:hypothetical protein